MVRRQPTNMGDTCQLFVLILCPGKEVNSSVNNWSCDMNYSFCFQWKQKGTKNGLETGRTFATLLADVNLRRRLLEVATEEEFKRLLLNRTRELMDEQRQSRTAVRIKLDNVGKSTRKNDETNDVSGE